MRKGKGGRGKREGRIVISGLLTPGSLRKVKVNSEGSIVFDDDSLWDAVKKKLKKGDVSVYLLIRDGHPLDKQCPPLDRACPPLDKACPPLDKACPPLNPACPPPDRLRPPRNRGRGRGKGALGTSRRKNR